MTCFPFPPDDACQTFVTKEGTKRSAIAVGKSITTVNIARLTVGNPSPMTPLTEPARVNTAIIVRRVGNSNITKKFLLNNRPPTFSQVACSANYKP